MVEISKRDWKLYRERLPKWQEHFMERLTREYIELLNERGYIPRRLRRKKHFE